MIVPMQKVEIVGRLSALNEILDRLQQSGRLHLDTIRREEVEPVPLTEGEREILNRLRAQNRLLQEIARDFPLAPAPRGFRDRVETWLPRLEELSEQLSRELQTRHRLLDEQADLKNYAQALEVLTANLRAETSPLVFTISRAEKTSSVRLAREILAELGVDDGDRILVVEMRGERVLLLVQVPQDLAETAHSRFREEGFADLRLPVAYETGRFQEAFQAVLARLSEIPRELQAVETRVQELLQKEGDFLGRAWRSVEDWIAFYEAKERFPRKTAWSFVLHGWVPRRDVPALVNDLKQTYGDQVVIAARDPLPEEYPRVPVILEGPSLIRPIQKVLPLYSAPVYGTVDPSGFLLMFWPVFFGFMLGDAGYGLLGALLFLFLLGKTRSSLLASVAKLYLWAMFWSIVFGILFGEVFGDLGTRVLGLQPIMMHRIHEVGALLAIAVLFGIIQVLLGLALGVVNHSRLGHRNHAWTEAFRFVGLVGLVFMVILPILSVVVKVPLPFWPFFWAGLVLFLVAAAGVVKFHGFVAPIEILSAMGNVFSYARLMAVGLASAILGEVANTLAGMTGFVLTVALVGVLFHLMNTFLGIFDPTVQGTRLQLVEFFSKFYYTNGVLYRPFRKSTA